MIRESIFGGETWLLISATGMILDSFETEGLAKQAQARFLEWEMKTKVEKL
jgi:hypothetical protein